jgi:hypothetical protein
MAGELVRPGVEVIQTFKTPSPSFVQPTLAPVVVGPAFEVINILTSEGTINSKAKYGEYRQIGKTITQSAFPDPRGNVDELNILEETIRPFMVAGGNLSELLMNPGESFLATSHGSARAAIKTKAFGVGLVLGGKTLVLAIDQPARLDTSDDISITFTGGTLSAAQAAAQINDAVGQEVASVVDTDRVMIASTKYGAMSSVTVRAGASANSVLEIGYETVGPSQREERVEGSGYRGQDDQDNDTLTPWIEFFRGDFLVNGTSTSFDPKAGIINSETLTFNSAQAAAVTFGDGNTIPIHVGDYIYVDGVKLKGGEIMKVESTRFKVGTINAALSTADANGRYITKVYDVQEVDTLFADSPFAPKYVWYKATGLDDATAAPTAASVSGSTSGAPAEQAVIEGVGAPAGPFLLTGLKLHYVVTVDGVETEGNFTFTNSYANMAAVAAAIGASIPGVNPTDAGGQLRLTTVKFGRLQAVRLKADGTANGSLGFSTSVDTADTGVDVEFKDIPAMITSGTQVVPTTTLTGTTLAVGYSTDGGATYPTTLTHAFAGEEVSVADIVSELQGDAGFTGGVLEVIDNGTTFSIRTLTGGSDIAIRINVASTSNGAGKLNLVNGTIDVGEENLNGQSLRFKLNSNPHIYEVSLASDSLDEAIDAVNALVGATVASKTGGGLDKLKLTSTLMGAASKVEVLAGKAATAFGLSTSPASGTARPFPDAYLDDLNNLVIGSEILRDQVTGYPLDFTFDFGTLYIQYKALRKDVSAVAEIAGVLRIPDVETLAAVLDPLTEDNPLGLALFLCMLNCPGFEVKGLGVDEITAAAPEGTALAYARAAGLLEAEEVYAIAPLTHDEVITGLWRTHVVAMSAPEQGGERIVFFNHRMPTRKNPGIAASGTQANSTATQNQLLLDVNPAAGLVALGLNPADPFTVEMGVYVELEVAGEFRRYNVSSVTGALANFNVVFTDEENVDGFYSTTPLTESVINAAWSLKVRGASLIIPGSNPPRLDYSLVAETVAEANAGLKNRRAYSVFPDTIKTIINGIEKSLPAYYACAATAGMVAGQPPQQPFTNFPITGLTGVVGTEKFTKRQLNIMAGGGTYILIQDVQGGPVSCRHQLSTDLTSIETRELSITKVVDFTAKFIRLGVRKFIGTQVINNQLLDTIGTTIQGMLQFLIENGVLNGANINNIVQDEAAPDTVLVDITLDVPFPCNYIRVTLVV